MNIFILNRDPQIAAQEMCDKHVVKMILESAQMLSTCHRVIDGKPERRSSLSGKRQTSYYKLDDWREQHMYRAVHTNHPCNVWLRESVSNYLWLYQHFLALLAEYNLRYGKQHSCERLVDPFATVPNNIKNGLVTSFALAMPDDCKTDDVVVSYQNYYNKYKNKFATWKIRKTPSWFQQIA
jgi:hypothetical protein